MQEKGRPIAFAVFLERRCRCGRSGKGRLCRLLQKSPPVSSFCQGDNSAKKWGGQTPTKKDNSQQVPVGWRKKIPRQRGTRKGRADEKGQQSEQAQVKGRDHRKGWTRQKKEPTLFFVFLLNQKENIFFSKNNRGDIFKARSDRGRMILCFFPHCCRCANKVAMGLGESCPTARGRTY